MGFNSAFKGLIQSLSSDMENIKIKAN